MTRLGADLERDGRRGVIVVSGGGPAGSGKPGEVVQNEEELMEKVSAALSRVESR